MRPWYSDVLKKDDPALRAEVARALLDQRALRKNNAEDHAGRIVEFRRGKAHLCGVLRPRKGTHGWKVLDQEGRERAVRGDKVIDISSERIELEPRDAVVRVLRAISRRREAVKARLDMRTLWEVATEAGERTWSLDELTELYFGEEGDGDRRAALARALDDGHWFDREDQAFAPRTQEVVAQGDLAIARKRERERRFQEWGIWLRGVADGEETERPEEAERAIELLERAVLKGEDGKEGKEAARLMGLAHLHGPLAAFDLLVRLGHWSPDENLELRRSRVRVEFSAEEKEMAEGVGWSAAARRSRAWRGGKVFGFSERGEDCDRAFGMRRTLFGYRVSVHLASPALLGEGEMVDAMARERASSLHLPERMIPMLPAAVVAHCRLTPAERRSALTVELRFGRDGRLKGRKILVRRVRPVKVLAWESAERALADDRHWKRLRELALTLRCQREEQDALIFPSSDVEPRVEEGRVEMRWVEGDDPVRQTCEELTILANATVAEFCIGQGIPAIYRVASAPTEKLDRMENERVWVHEQIRLLARATLQVEPGRHGALGVEGYVPVSQPLHRYPDLLMHRQLAEYLHSGRSLLTQEEVERALEETAWMREAVGRIEREGRRYWTRKYLEGKQGEEVEAVVLERRGNGYLVELCDCRLKGSIHGGNELWAVPGDRMRVKVGQVSARRDLVRLTEAREE